MQLNRVDVYASNAASNSFVEPHNDYCGGCAYLDVDFGSKFFQYQDSDTICKCSTVGY
jgi:hypothetical protein